MPPPEEGALAHDPDEAEDSPWVDVGRLVSLSDGIFAFAMTLLAIDLVVPTWGSGPGPADLEGWLGAQLQGDAFQFLAYAFAFAMIAIWWSAHQRLFQRIRRADRALTWMNMGFLMGIAVTPFVLRLLTTDDYSSTFLGSGVFLAAEGLTSLTLTGMWYYATEGHRLVDPTLSRRAIERSRQGTLARTVIFAAALAVAFVRPEWGIDTLWAIFIFQAVDARRRRAAKAGPARPGPLQTT